MKNYELKAIEKVLSSINKKNLEKHGYDLEEALHLYHELDQDKDKYRNKEKLRDMKGFFSEVYLKTSVVF